MKSDDQYKWSHRETENLKCNWNGSNARIQRQTTYLEDKETLMKVEQNHVRVYYSFLWWTSKTPNVWWTNRMTQKLSQDIRQLLHKELSSKSNGTWENISDSSDYREDSRQKCSFESNTVILGSQLRSASDFGFRRLASPEKRTHWNVPIDNRVM